MQHLWRFAIYLLVLSLIFTPVASAAPGIQESDPGAAEAQDVQESEPGSIEAQDFQGIDPEAAAAPGDHLVTDIILSPDTPNILKTDQRVTLNFSYSTTQPVGVRIFIRPFTNGSLSPNFSAHPSEIFPTSATGKGSGWFTITSGEVVVDQIRIQMWNDNQTTLLFQAFLPVHYLFSDASSLVNNVFLTIDTPDVLKFNQNLNLRFDYTNRSNGAVLIFARPFTNGALTPNYAASGSPDYAPGSGSGTGYFTITSGQVVVDQIRIQMWNLSQTVLLFEAFLPVYYRFRSSANIVTNIEFSPDTPNIFKYGSNVNLTFSYTTNQPGNVRIFARPFSGANLTTNYGAHGSPEYPSGSGNGSGWFTLNSGPRTVDRVQIQMWNLSQTALLFEAFLPVDLQWAGAGPPPGPDMRIDAVEVTQAIQDLNNSVDLVAGKRTYVRVHVSSPANASNVYATLSGRRGLVTLNPVLSPGNPGGGITVRTGPDRGQINDSFWFVLPSDWTSAGDLTLTARLDPINAKNDLVQGNNTRTTTVNFKSTPGLRLRLFNVQYTASGTTYLANTSHLSKLESWLRRAYPIANLQVTRQTFVYPNAGVPNVDTLNSWLALSKVFRVLFSGEDGRIVYYGIVDDGGGFMRGAAVGIPSTVASGPTGPGTWDWDFDGSYGDWYGGHEIGHTRGRLHAMYCGAADGGSYPYANGRISPSLTGNGAIYGFDIVSRTIYGPNWKDVMTYCNNQWISDFTYEAIRSYLVSVGAAGAGLEMEAAPEMVSANQFLVISGMADLETSTAVLNDVYLISQETTMPLPDPGDWTIALLGPTNNLLASFPFMPDELTDSEGSTGRPAIIAEAVPWAAGASKVEIRYQGKVVASRSASPNAPSVDLLTPAAGSSIPAGPFTATWSGSDPDGDPLAYTLLYSNDLENWDTLATGLTGTSLPLHTDQLPGGSGALRIVASDGFLTAQDVHAGLVLPLHAPSAEILQPTQNQVFYPTQPVTMEGTGYDLEDGDLNEDQFEWSSSIDGFLGSGRNLSTAELTTGTHTLTLQVMDSDGMSTQVQRSITIAEAGTPVALNLEAAPWMITEMVTFGSGPVQQDFSLRSSSSVELNWTASESISWLSLAAVSGQTPADFVVTITPGSLQVGTHSGVITFSSPGAANSPLEVNVMVQVTGSSIYLPMVRR